MVRVDMSEYADVSADRIDQGGLPAPGKAHFLVTDVDVDADRGNVNITCRVIAHEKATEVGKKSFNNFKLGGKGSRRGILFALATGLITKEGYAAAQAGEQAMDIDFFAAEGKTFCGPLTKGEFNGRETCKVEFKFLRPDSEDAKDYPKDEGYLTGEKKANEKVPF